MSSETKLLGEQKEQLVVSRSSVDAKFRFLSHDICERMWLQRIFDELRIPSLEHIKVLYDNQSTIDMVKNLLHHN